MAIPKRGTILILSGTTHAPEKDHLFVVCTEPCSDGFQLLVPIASLINNLCDQTCRLRKGEHEFIHHESFVLYRKSRIEDAVGLQEAVDQKRLKTRESMNGQTFLRIKNGICKSVQTPRRIKMYFGCDVEVTSTQLY